MDERQTRALAFRNLSRNVYGGRVDCMSIEEILDRLNQKGIKAVLILKANEGYSAITISKHHYTAKYLLRDHFNGKTVLDALKRLEEINDLP